MTKSIKELITKDREYITRDGNIVFPAKAASEAGCLSSASAKSRKRIHLLALGDVGGTVLLGLKLEGGDILDEIGIYDLDPRVLRRYEREMNQICFPDGRRLPQVEILEEDQLFDCDMFVFCASRGVPPVGASGDVRMAQFETNRGLVEIYAKAAVSAGFGGIFAVVSDPVDPLCKAAVLAGLPQDRIQGYGLGVMNGRARYFATKEDRFQQYLAEGRAFGPHGEDLVIADSISHYDDSCSRELTERTVKSNLDTRADGFKPYIAPAISSGALSLLETLRGGWNYSSVFLGNDGEGAFLGCRNRRCGKDLEEIHLEDLPLSDELFQRIENAYQNLCRIR